MTLRWQAITSIDGIVCWVADRYIIVPQPQQMRPMAYTIYVPTSTGRMVRWRTHEKLCQAKRDAREHRARRK